MILFILLFLMFGDFDKVKTNLKKIKFFFKKSKKKHKHINTESTDTQEKRELNP